MNASFDVAVIGAGPAGAAAALTAARQGHSVGLFEPQQLPDKPCGEGILPSGVAVLEALGMKEVLGRAQALERIRYVLASGRELVIALPSAGRSLERPLLAEALARALEREPRITLIRKRATSRPAATGLEVRCGDETWSARTLIAADGLPGEAAHWLRSPHSTPRRYGLRARVEARVPLEHVEVHLGRASEVYLTPLGERRINVAVLRDGLPLGDRSCAACLTEALNEHPRAARWIGDWVTPPEARALGRALPRRVAGAGTFLVGDAAGGVDPVLGCGVAIALSTGLAAARAASLVLGQGSGAPEREYARFVRRDTRGRRALADALVFLARHPRLQETVARVLTAWPTAVTHLARRVADPDAFRRKRPRASEEPSIPA